MRRELNEIEYFNWCVGQPYNMVAVARFRGDLRADRLRAALAKARERHPLLGVNTEIAPDGLPWFSSDGVGAIPLAVHEQAGPEDARRLAESALATRFAMDEAGPDRLPLMRVALFLPADPEGTADVVFTVQHIIADGLSMLFLVRDLLAFMDEPDASVEVLDAPARPDDLLPARVRRRIPTSPLRFRIALWLARVYAWIRFRSPPPDRQPTARHRAWSLTPEQTSRLRARCREEGVSVQSAICTAFLPAFPAVHTPVDLRGGLARPVGESVGLFVGAAEVKLRYRPARGFWGNARAFHRRLRRALRDPLSVLRLFSKAVSPELVRQLGGIMVRMTAGQRPFAVTNLGVLDGVRLKGRDLEVASFFGAVTGIVDSSVLMVYTLDGRLRLHLLASEAGPAETTVRDDAEHAVARLLEAL